ncbi:DUF1616 domain-containing protein [Halospeciosus flavus]|uniref:DUF1616 domain-containing protein n=1 Tax=Halospeciosus flavus TaxID=3032283 RepID=A0ABD5YZY2_9EURY|nr:DUF1616 domain-containing protein [Halospeciosus flavus]
MAEPSRRAVAAGVATATLAAGTTVLPAGSALRLAFALALVGLLPGYALTTALFPVGLSPVRRAASALGFSLVLVPLVGLGLAALGVPLDRLPFLVAITGLTLCLLGIGVSRRRQVDADADSDTSGDGQFDSLDADRVERWVSGETPLDTGLRIAVVATAVLATTALLIGVVAPYDGTTYTETALFTENESGALVAGNYPTDRNAGDVDPLVYRLVNHEGRAVDYGVVYSCQRVGSGGSVEEAVELSRLTERVEAGGSLRITDPPTCPLDGERVRLVFSLYRGSIPDDPSMDEDYRTLTLWVNTPTNASNTTATTTRPARVSRG